MTKAFKRIAASDLEDCLDKGELPEELVAALREAITNARGNNQWNGEAPIQVFVTNDGEDDDE